MLEWMFSIPILGDFFKYLVDPNYRGELIFRVILLIIWPLLTIFWKTFREPFLKIWKWVDMYRLNPDLDLEVSISGEIPLTTSNDFITKMGESLRNISSTSIVAHAGDSFKFAKNFNSFDGNIIISPSLDSLTNNYNFVSIRIRTTNIKLNKFEEGLSEIQIYLFRDIVNPLIQRIRLEADRNNEGISVKLRDLPVIYQLAGGLNVDDITASDDDIRVTITKDNISINGNIESRSIKKIENIIRSNLAT